MAAKGVNTPSKDWRTLAGLAEGGESLTQALEEEHTAEKRSKRTASPPREGALKAAVIKELRRRRITFRKRHGTPYQVAGDPDLYFLVRGLHVEVELKRPGESPTELQKVRLKEWADAGAVVAVVRTPAEFRSLLDWVEGLWEVPPRAPGEQPPCVVPSLGP